MKMTALPLPRPADRRGALLMALAIAASLAIAALGLMACLSLIAVTASAAPAVERYVIDGDRLEVCNLAGAVRVVSGAGPSTEVFLVRGGRDGSRLRVFRTERNGVTHLHVIYPERRIVYRNAHHHGSTNLTVGSDGCLEQRHSAGFFGRRVTIRSAGPGMEAWADLEIRVPAGRAPAVRLGVGEIEARDLDGEVLLDTGSGSVTVQDTRGSMTVDTGSGGVRLVGHEGELSIDTGSGEVEIAKVHGGKNVRLDTGSGHVSAADVEAGQLLIDTGSGGVEMDGVRSPDISVDTGSGSVRVGLDSSPHNLKIDTGSGGVHILAPADLSALVDLESGSGGIDTDFSMSNLRHDHGELHGQIGDGAGRIVVDVGSGGVSLRRR
jgi:lia operon protein LiaG